MLGYTLVRVDDIINKPAQSLDQAKGEIAAALLADKRKAALATVTTKLEDSFDKGGALTDAAKETGRDPAGNRPLLADGSVFGKPGEKAPADLAKAVPPPSPWSVNMRPSWPSWSGQEVPDLRRGQITPAALPLAQIKPAVIQAIQMEKGAVAAKAAALKVLDKMKHGGDLARRGRGSGSKLPPIQQVSMSRDQMQAQGGQIPPAMGLFFSMAKGTTKLLPLPAVAVGWWSS
jgi:peptidyl-prolyl cis-trans isomerase D